MRLPKIFIFCFIVISVSVLKAQVTDTYTSLYEKGDFNKSLEMILLKLNEIYGKKLEDKRIPAGYIALKKTGEDQDLIKLFRNRKEKGFFIEENNELAELHVYAGRCSIKLNKKKDALNHFIQSMRFKKYEQMKDDAVFYEISQIFKSYKEPAYFKGYIDALEQSYSFNPMNYRYSLELGLALTVTKDKKKAIFHLKKYIENTEEKIDPELYLRLGSLNEGIENYLEAEKYYNEYLRFKPENAEILFGLGYISYYRTGNYILAESSLKRAVQILKEEDYYRRSKSFEYLGDMSYNNLKYEKAIAFYSECIVYQNKILEKTSLKETERKAVIDEINILKDALINSKQFERYEEYEILKDAKSKLDREIENLNLEFNKLHPGRLRWYMAESNEKTGKYDEAIKYFREAIKYDYFPNEAREKIIKLQLKIKRGY
jgi:tetratricopeptide (TPR) repeat protein